MIDRKFISAEFLQSVNRVLIVPAVKKEKFKYLKEDVIEEETRFIFFKRKIVHKKGFYTDKTDYIKAQDNYYLEDGVVWSKPFIRLFYKDPSDVTQSVYIVRDTHDEILDVFNRFAEKTNLIEYT